MNEKPDCPQQEKNMARTSLSKGQILECGFEILDVRELPEFEAQGIWARHQKSGAEVYHVLNGDIENLFSFTFATPPEDSTGVPHIIEHSVFCGSETYPLKDAFLILAQGSLQTYLNAWTYPDKTIYPASSVNEQDYFNLMSVYGDAVFRPLLTEWTFMQEGHRLIFTPDNEEGGEGDEGQEKEPAEKSGLRITGVVYNEMKGAYSSLDAYAGLWSVKAVMPDTPYDFESGGDPDSIPDLSWEELKAFHRKWYTPANCRIFLAGNIPTEKQLAFLEEKFFSALPPGKRNDPVNRTIRWDSCRSFQVPCPAGAEQKPTVLLSWLCGDATDTDETLDLAALSEILLGHDGSPLMRVLVDSGLGEDLSPVSGLEGNLRETVFSVGLRGVGRSDKNRKINGKRGETGTIKETAKKVEELILGELSRLEREGIPKEETEAALLGMEFTQREIRRSSGPFSLVWMLRSLRAWSHGGQPWDSLLITRSLEKLKSRIGEDKFYFEKMIRRYFLENPHRAFIVIEPEENFLEEKEAALGRRLEEKEASLGSEEKKALKEKEAQLIRVQEKEDSQEALAKIPHLSRNDLSPEVEIIKREYADARGIPLLINPFFTNGISYVKLAFPLDIFPPEDYLWFPFFSRAVVSVGLPGMDYGEVSSLMARTVGGCNAVLQSGSPVPGAARTEAFPMGILDIKGRDWLFFGLKTLDEKIGASMDLAFDLITKADFSDERRIKDLLLEMKNSFDTSLAPGGHHFASGRSSRLFSRSLCVEDLWNGLDQILFAHKLTSMDISEVCKKLKTIQEGLAGAGVLAHITGASPVLMEKEIGKRFGSFGPPRPRSYLTQDKESFIALSEINRFSNRKACKAEVFSSPSLQVGFAAFSLSAFAYGSPLEAAELVLAHLLSTGALWEDIRMKGGAYGASAQVDNLEGPFIFSTYRDPDPLRSLEAFSSIIMDMHNNGESAGKGVLNEDIINKAVIGTFSRKTRPQTPSEKSSKDFLRFLYGIEDRQRSRYMRDILTVSGAEIRTVLGRLASELVGAGPLVDSRRGVQAFQGGVVDTHPVIITGKPEAENAAMKLGAEIFELPV